MAQNEDEELGYLSTSPMIARKVEKSVIVDERDLPTLKRLKNQISSDIDAYRSIDKIVLGDTVFTVEQQMDINQKLVAHLRHYETMVENGILGVKEAQDARG